MANLRHVRLAAAIALLAVTGCSPVGTTPLPPTSPMTSNPNESNPPNTTQSIAGEPAFASYTFATTEPILGSSWRQGCPVGPEELVVLGISYWDFSGEENSGELIVHEDVVSDIEAVFKRLFEERFPIELVVPVNVFESDDNLSMENNNTSAFNCRFVEGTDTWSEHAFGRAIDINPVQNPYVSTTVLPAAGAAYLDRTYERTGMVLEDGVVVEAFESVGWRWGGRWDPPDYQHFSESGR